MGKQVNETVADVIDALDMYNKTLFGTTPFGCQLATDIDNIVARLRRAHGKEVHGWYMANREEALKDKPLNNANEAAIREALEDSHRLLGNFAWGGYGAQVREQMRDNKSALSAPARNCDLYRTPWDVVTHWDGGIDSAQDIVRMLDWLFAEAKGEAK